MATYVGWLNDGHKPRTTYIKSQTTGRGLRRLFLELIMGCITFERPLQASRVTEGVLIVRFFSLFVFSKAVYAPSGEEPTVLNRERMITRK